MIHPFHSTSFSVKQKVHKILNIFNNSILLLLNCPRNQDKYSTIFNKHNHSIDHWYTQTQKLYLPWKDCSGGQPYKTKRRAIVSRTFHRVFHFLFAVSCFRTTWLVWICKGFFFVGEGLGGFESLGVLCLFSVCIMGLVSSFVFKLFRNTTYCENLTAQRTLLE